MQWIGRRGHVVDVIKREVLSQNRRALVVYGDGHFLRFGRWVGTPAANPTLVNLIEQHGARTFSIWTNTTVELERMQRDIASWPIPSLTLIRGTRLGRLNFKYFSGLETDPPTRMEEQYDAVLYLGAVSSSAWGSELEGLQEWISTSSRDSARRTCRSRGNEFWRASFRRLSENCVARPYAGLSRNLHDKGIRPQRDGGLGWRGGRARR